jgi:hypothetical protein
MTVRKHTESNSMSSPIMLDKGGRSELTQGVDKRNRRAVAWSMLVEMLHFEQRDQHSANAARQIGKSRVSHDSPCRILLWV